LSHNRNSFNPQPKKLSRSRRHLQNKAAQPFGMSNSFYNNSAVCHFLHFLKPGCLKSLFFFFFFFFGVEFIVYGGVVTYMRHYFIYALRWAPSAPLSLSPHKHRRWPTLWWHPPMAHPMVASPDGPAMKHRLVGHL